MDRELDLNMYDRMPTFFTSEGRLLQVEYAKQASKSGSTAIGFAAKDGVLIIGYKNTPHKLILTDYIEKISFINSKVLGTYAGFISDGRLLIDFLRERAQEYKVTYGNDDNIELLLRDLSDVMEYHTRIGGLRPFAVSIIIAGIDRNEPKVFGIDPSGIYYRYSAVAIGEFEDKLMNILPERYNPNMDINSVAKLGVDLLKEMLGNNFTFDRLSLGYIKINGDSNLLNGEAIKKLYEQQQ